jgi:acetylornithine deacetylase/succinyl-diaminopimelate desuccinylase-like protein
VRALLDNPALEVSADDPTLRPLFHIAAEVNGYTQETPMGVGYFTDAVKFAASLRAPFAICGPGNPKLNHQSDEWVEIQKLRDSVQIYTIAAMEYLG